MTTPEPGEQDDAIDFVASEALVSHLYEVLRRMASRRMGRERAGHTLQTTDLVHEAWLKLEGGKKKQWKGREHFLATASHAMRSVLVDHCRSRATQKRGGGLIKVSLNDQDPAGEGVPIDVIALDEALELLSEESERQAQIVELRFFGGLTMQEISELLNSSLRTVNYDWAMARAWLHRQLYTRSHQEC